MPPLVIGPIVPISGSGTADILSLEKRCQFEFAYENLQTRAEIELEGELTVKTRKQEFKTSRLKIPRKSFVFWFSIVHHGRIKSRIAKVNPVSAMFHRHNKWCSSARLAWPRPKDAESEKQWWFFHLFP